MPQQKFLEEQNAQISSLLMMYTEAFVFMQLHRENDFFCFPGLFYFSEVNRFTKKESYNLKLWQYPKYAIIKKIHSRNTNMLTSLNPQSSHHLRQGVSIMVPEAKYPLFRLLMWEVNLMS